MADADCRPIDIVEHLWAAAAGLSEVLPPNFLKHPIQSRVERPGANMGWEGAQGHV